MAAVSALCDKNTLGGLREIVKHLACFVVENDSSNWNVNLEVLAIAAMTVAAFPMAPAIGTKYVIEPEFQKGVFVRVGHEINAAAVSAVAAARSALRDKLLPPECDATVTAVAGFNCDFGFVDEHRIKAGLEPLPLFYRLDGDESASTALVFKLNDARDLGEKRVVLANPDIDARLEPCATLPDENRSARHDLARKTLHAKPLRMAVAAIS